MKLKRIVIAIISLLSLVSSASAYAFFEDEDLDCVVRDPIITYGGLGYKHIWVDPQGDWGRIFENSFPGFGIFFGLRPITYFGAELGFNWTANKPKSTAINPNGTFLGITNGPPFATAIHGRMRFKSGYLDFNGYLPIPVTPCFIPEFVLSLGVATVLDSIHIKIDPPGSGGAVSQVTAIKGRSKAVFRIGAGFQTLLIENLGINIMWRWENFSALQAKIPAGMFVSPRRPFGNANSISVGLYLQY